MDIEKKAIELKSSRTPFCWATVVKSDGSTPRHPGSKMIITRDASFGTIGGGALEHRVIEDARGMLSGHAAECRRYPLGPMLGQCCGGETEVFIEPVVASKPMYVFGAGHVAEALVPMLGELGFNVTLIDERPERINLPSFSHVHQRWNELPSDILRKMSFNSDTHIIVFTHEHKHDEEIVRFCIDKEFKYLGCIGSRTKWEKFKARYRAQGVTDDQIARVSTPIGLNIGAETPFEIAIAIAAELIQLNALPDDFIKRVGRF